MSNPLEFGLPCHFLDEPVYQMLVANGLPFREFWVPHGGALIRDKDADPQRVRVENVIANMRSVAPSVPIVFDTEMKVYRGVTESPTDLSRWDLHALAAAAEERGHDYSFYGLPTQGMAGPRLGGEHRERANENLRDIMERQSFFAIPLYDDSPGIASPEWDKFRAHQDEARRLTMMMDTTPELAERLRRFASRQSGAYVFMAPHRFNALEARAHVWAAHMFGVKGIIGWGMKGDDPDMLENARLMALHCQDPANALEGVA